MTRTVWAALAVAAVAACGPDGSADAAPCSEIVDVYASAVAGLTQIGRSRLVVIDTNTAPLPPETAAGIPEELMKSFNAAQAVDPPVRCAALGETFRSVDATSLDALFDGLPPEEAWAQFRAAQGAQGYWTLSAVGFDRHLEQAVCLVGYLCGPRCGEGKLVRLKKRKGLWVVVDAHEVWSS